MGGADGEVLVEVRAPPLASSVVPWRRLPTATEATAMHRSEMCPGESRPTLRGATSLPQPAAPRALTPLTPPARLAYVRALTRPFVYYL